MGCNFCSKNKIIYKNELSINNQNVTTNPLRKINTETYIFEVSDANNIQYEYNKDNISNLKSATLSPIILKSKKRLTEDELKIKLVSNIKGFLFRKKYEDYLKTQLMDHTNDLYFEFINLTKNFKSTKLLNNKDNNKIKNILKTKWDEFYSKDPSSIIKNKINKTKKYTNGLIFKYKKRDIDPSNIEDFQNNVISCYKGSVELISNKKCGNGEFVSMDGTQQIGTFYNDKFCGWNTLLDKDGVIFIGLFNNDLLNVKGLSYNADTNCVYKGTFKNLMKEGNGEEVFNGCKYIGEFKEDKKNGKGKMIFKNGDVYDGEFEDDKINGFGRFKWSNKNKEYQGNFVNGKINGNGILKWGDDMYYKGYFNNGIKEGNGECGFVNKKVFFFNFKNDLPCGKGYCIDKYNRKCDVIYRHGKIIDVYLNEIIFIFE